MLEYSYKILSKVSFDKDLFRKELKKCLSYLAQKDAQKLQAWVNANYKSMLVPSK